MYFSFFKLTSCVEKWAYYNLYAVSKVKTSSKKDIHTRHWIYPSPAYISDIDIMDSALVLYRLFALLCGSILCNNVEK